MSFVVLLETWLKEKHGERWFKSLPEGYKWGRVYVKRMYNKWRAEGEIIFGVKEEDGKIEGNFTWKSNSIFLRDTAKKRSG